MNLLSKIESILFVASKPLGLDTIARTVKKNQSEVLEGIENLKLKYNRDNSGINILQQGDTYQMATNPENTESVEGFIKNEVSGELTRAQLETLTVIAYRGPITCPELEQIRGVNCSLIIRNLMVRGLIVEEENNEKLGHVYSLSIDALAALGVKEAAELPEYEKFNSHEFIENVLAK